MVRFTMLMYMLLAVVLTASNLSAAEVAEKKSEPPKIPDLSQYDAETLRMLATNLYRKVDGLESRVKELEATTAELESMKHHLHNAKVDIARLTKFKDAVRTAVDVFGLAREGEALLDEKVLARFNSVITSMMSASAKAATIARDFEAKDISYRDNRLGMTEVIGEITNKSDTSYEVALFSLSIYSPDGKLIAAEKISITNFHGGETKPFRAMIGSQLPDGAKHKVQFDMGY